MIIVYQVLPLLQQLVLSLQSSEIDDHALARLRAALDVQSYEKLEVALDAFEFQEAIAIAEALMKPYGNSHE